MIKLFSVCLCPFPSIIDHMEYHPTLLNTTESISHCKCGIPYFPYEQYIDLNPTEEHFIEDLVKCIEKINPTSCQIFNREKYFSYFV